MQQKQKQQYEHEKQEREKVVVVTSAADTVPVRYKKTGRMSKPSNLHVDGFSFFLFGYVVVLLCVIHIL